ncbi:hypothetical protein ACFQV8_36300 [Pseudonocardia benzenivorans]
MSGGTEPSRLDVVNIEQILIAVLVLGWIVYRQVVGQYASGTKLTLLPLLLIVLGLYAVVEAHPTITAAGARSSAGSWSSPSSSAGCAPAPSASRPARASCTCAAACPRWCCGRSRSPPASPSRSAPTMWTPPPRPSRRRRSRCRSA